MDLSTTFEYRTVGNFRGVLIFVDFVGPTQTTKNSRIDPRKYNFLGLKTTNLSLFHIMHIAMLCSYNYSSVNSYNSYTAIAIRIQL